MLWGDSLYDISNSFDAIFRQGQRDEILKWVVERKEKGTVKFLIMNFQMFNTVLFDSKIKHLKSYGMCLRRIPTLP